MFESMCLSWTVRFRVSVPTLRVFNRALIVWTFRSLNEDPLVFFSSNHFIKSEVRDLTETFNAWLVPDTWNISLDSEKGPGAGPGKIFDFDPRGLSSDPQSIITRSLFWVRWKKHQLRSPTL